MHSLSITRSFTLAMLVVAGQSAWPADDCDAPPESWQPRSAVQALAQRKGWRVEKLKIDDGCYEVKGRDANGRRFKAKIDPATLELISLKREQGDRDRDRDRDRDGKRSPASPAPSSHSPRTDSLAPSPAPERG